MISIAKLRADRPEFADAAAYTDAAIQLHLDVAAMMINQARWGASASVVWPALPSTQKLALYDHGVELFVAHNLVLDAIALRGAASGTIPGLASGVATSRSVDKVSVSYDANIGIEADAGHWALSIYGSQFLRLLRQAGMGPLHVMGC